MIHRFSSRVAWFAFVGFIVLIVAGGSVACASLTFSGASLSGNSPIVIDGSSTISIGTSTATGIIIGNSSSTVSFPGNISANGNVAIGTTEFVTGTGDISTAINNAMTACPSAGCVIDATGYTPTGIAAATITLSKPVDLKLPAGLIMSTQNPVIQIAGLTPTKIEGLGRTATEIRYIGAGAADIVACGSPSATAISCAYVTLSDLMIRPMEGSVATVGFHAYNPLNVVLNNVASLISQCTGDLNDSPQASCTPAITPANIAAEFQVNPNSPDVPPAGGIEIENWISATGRGSDPSLTGTSRGIWFNGNSSQDDFVNIVLDGSGDDEAAHTPLATTYVTNMSVGAGWLLGGSSNGTGFVSESSSIIQFYGTKFENNSTNWNVDSSNDDIQFWNVSMVDPSTLGVNNAIRGITVVPSSGGGLFNIGSVPFSTSGTIAGGATSINGVASITTQDSNTGIGGGEFLNITNTNENVNTRAGLHLVAGMGGLDFHAFLANASTGNTFAGLSLYNGGAWCDNCFTFDSSGDFVATGTVAADSGTNTVYRCTVAGTLRVGQLTTVPSDCGTAVDTGFRSN